MKVIISHDVDHLYRNDHYADLIYPKMWVRETQFFFKREICAHEWWLRMIFPFQTVRHHIYELIDFDKKHNVVSTFFFGMERGLGMSYKKERSVSVINHVKAEGFSAGVRGFDFNNSFKMKREHDTFKKLTDREPEGIRMNYVRYDCDILKFLNDCGYPFDSTEFYKKRVLA